MQHDTVRRGQVDMICNFYQRFGSADIRERAAHRPTKTKKALTKQPTGDVVSKEEEDRPGDGWDSAPDDWEAGCACVRQQQTPLADHCIQLHLYAHSRIRCIVMHSNCILSA